MTTLHVDLGREWRGGQGQALLLVNGLRGLGKAAELVAVEGSPLAGHARATGAHVHQTGRLAPRLQAAFRIRELLSQRPYGVVHCHDAHGLTAAWLARAHTVGPVVASRRVAYPISKNRLALDRYRSTRRIVAISRFVEASVLASGLSGVKVEMIHDGVEIPRLPSRDERMEARRRWIPSTPHAPLLGCVGHLLTEKGQELLIRALTLVRLRRPDCRLLLAGGGPCRKRLEQLASALGVRGAVDFTGVVEDVTEVYRALDVFLFPSLEEPLGSSLLAAMAWGLPPVALGTGAVPEIVADGRNGLLVPRSEAPAFADAVLRVLDNPALAASIGAAARRTIEQRFSAARMVESTLDLYGRIWACE